MEPSQGARPEDELRNALVELAHAQARADARMDQLAARMDQLAARMDELAAAQARADARMDQLAARMDELGRRVDGLTRTVEDLLASVRELVVGLHDVRKQLGGIAETIGSDIEDAALTVVYYVLEHDFGWKVHSLDGSSWQQWDDRGEEVDFFGVASDPSRPGITIWIVGEAKTNLTDGEVSRFASKVARARRVLVGEVFPLCFCRRAHPDVQARVKAEGLELMFGTGRIAGTAGRESKGMGPAR